jgi:branched-chain amino acid transport system ATP-binding protein
MVIDRVYETLVDLNRAGLSILLMEQNASRALHVADYAYVLRSGRVELEGTAADLGADPDFDRAYFGFDASAGLVAA